jgi:predicted dehydrogenase
MKKVTFAILGMGNRGTRYAMMQLKYPEEMEVTAIADNRPIRMESANKFLNLPQDRMFDSAEAILAADKLADMMIIATQDAQHRDHAIRAMEIGYDLLLEKPISNKLEDIAAVVEAAERLNRKVFICHVLRYTPFYREVKSLLDQGLISEKMYEAAANRIHSMEIRQEFFRHSDHRNGEEDHGCS